MYPLFETIKILDGRPQNLYWHQLRVDRSWTQIFAGNKIPSLEALISVPPEFQSGVVKCKFMYNLNQHRMEFSAYQARIIRSLKLIFADNLEYSLKYTDRKRLDELYELKGASDEILLVKGGRITDTSYTNIVFYNGNRWETPAKALLKGTCRDRLLQEGRIFETDIAVEDIESYHSFRLINAMLDFDEQEELPVNVIN